MAQPRTSYAQLEVQDSILHVHEKLVVPFRPLSLKAVRANLHNGASARHKKGVHEPSTMHAHYDAGLTHGSQISSKAASRLPRHASACEDAACAPVDEGIQICDDASGTRLEPSLKV
eukprot:CAMPEP_0181234308 /NCGR_PEP_ID=MMETSP1096-20121128/36881_1 /TAXON_ID=156174 ORGANISM="Chrysochromulina ericina, Strain CCMP281" /NCGR_SAMPLE_ID=MMETSP1096 /ASSEMBLY_ACC=CAM_ASM_000453 /LENGTH=116 /DNA_ID=CAMNT_0023329029 /DNA_START=369 /DNA_END=719 /DNA_ORIENTATION=-